MIDLIVGVLAVLGSLLMLLAAVGLLRMPDLLTRMSATAKAASLGVGLVLVGAALHFEDVGVTMRALATVLFIFLTSPTAAHLIARAAYFLGVEIYSPSGLDELRARYDTVTHELESGEDGSLPPAQRSRVTGGPDQSL